MELVSRVAICLIDCKGDKHGSWNSSVVNRRANPGDYYLGSPFSSLNPSSVFAKLALSGAFFAEADS